MGEDSILTLSDEFCSRDTAESLRLRKVCNKVRGGRVARGLYRIIFGVTAFPRGFLRFQPLLAQSLQGIRTNLADISWEVGLGVDPGSTMREPKPAPAGLPSARAAGIRADLLVP